MNMTFIQLRDVLQRIEEIHREAADICDRASHRENGRLSLLVDFFRQWEERLDQCCHSFPENERQPFLESWVQFAGTGDIEAAIDQVRQAAESDADELIASLLRLQERIVQLLHQLAGSQQPPEVHEKLLAFAEFEEKASRDLSSALVMEKDA